MEAGNESGRRRSLAGESSPSHTLHAQLAKLLTDLEALGIVTQLAGKVVGGVAMTSLYYQHALHMEGRADETPACQLLIAKLKGHEVEMIPATQEELEQGLVPELPREAPVFSRIMSPAALSDLHWLRMPAVVLFGCFVADEAELAEAAAAGIPISPSMLGPHPEELNTQMEVFLKQHTYPDNKTFIMRDWGFVIFGAELSEVIATFNSQLKEALVLGTEAADVMGDGDGSAAAQLSSSADGVNKGHMLANAFKQLRAKVGLLRTQSEPAAEDLDAAAAAMSLRSPKAPGAVRPGGPAVSEPSTPLMGSELPESIRTISTVNRRNSVECRVPSFQTGFKPW